MEIALDINPPVTTAQSASRIMKTSTGRLFIGKDRKRGRFASEWNIIDCLLKQNAPAQPFVGAIEVSIELVYPWRSGERKHIRAQKQIPKTTKPDLDNLSKQFLDFLQKHGYFMNDSQVSCLILRKFWGDDPGIKISLKNI